MKVVLTGAHGFIGSQVADEIRGLGHELLPLERGHRMHRLPLEKIARFGPEACVHTAWIATPGNYQESPLNVAHRQWSEQLVQEFAGIGVKHFVVLGTCAEYAPASHALNEETDRILPRTTYAREKHALHTLIGPWIRSRGATLAWLRIFFPYGPSEHPDRLISQLRSHFQAGTFSPDLLREPTAVRDYVHVSDVARAIALVTEDRSDGTFNIGSGVGVCLAELVNLVARRYGSSCPLFGESVIRGTKCDTVVADITKLRRLGWMPRYDLEAGLRTYPEMRGPT